MADHEGKKLRMLLAAHGKRPTDLADAAGVSAAAIAKYWGHETFKPAMFDRIIRALFKLGIDPGELRPGTPRPSMDFSRSVTIPWEEAEALFLPNPRSLLDKFDRKQYEALLELLGSDQIFRSSVRLLIEDRMGRAREDKKS